MDICAFFGNCDFVKFTVGILVFSPFKLFTLEILALQQWC